MIIDARAEIGCLGVHHPAMAKKAETKLLLQTQDKFCECKKCKLISFRELYNRKKEQELKK